MEMVNDKIDREVYDKEGYECVDFDNNFAKAFSKKCKLPLP